MIELAYAVKVYGLLLVLVLLVMEAILKLKPAILTTVRPKCDRSKRRKAKIETAGLLLSKH